MRQELAFLEHLTRLLGADDDAGAYGPGGMTGTARHTAPAPSTHRVLDLKA
jgi:hypothetical protein